MRLTKRDERSLELVAVGGALRLDQIQIGADHSLTHDSRCQRRFTLLRRHRYVDILPRRPTDPAVYVLSKRSTAGNRLMRERLGPQFRPRASRLGAVGHVLAVNDIWVRVLRACRELGWELRCWQRPEELAEQLAGAHLLPDGYFQIVRTVDGALKTSGFFLEVERSSRNLQVLRSKLQRYGRFVTSGTYHERFGLRALRLLIIFDYPTPEATTRSIGRGVALAHALGISLAHFASLPELRRREPVGCLRDPIWRSPRATEPIVLFEQ